ncbi:MAG: tetratricopeptide repeat protein [Flavobacteriales bacterium]|jgi:TolA-binding protein|nr:tetratricopeptide repeat protein [Flavobacteriales bacterium]
MSEQEIEFEEIEATSGIDGDIITQGQDFLKGPGKFVLIAIAGIAVLIGGYFAYNKFVVAPKDVKSVEAMYMAEHYLLDKEDYATAINGDANGAKGLEALAKSSYAGGEIAKYDLGIAYLNNGQYQEAIKVLKDVNFKDDVLGTEALGMIGDAYLELDDLSSALDFYTKAYKNRENILTTPMYMMKAAQCMELLNNYTDAAEIYEKLIADYPFAKEKNNAEKYLAMVKQGKSIYSITK